jgi:hypothetical protein
LLESSVFGWAGLTVVVGFVFGWWDVSDGFEDAVVVEPVDPFQGGVLDVVDQSEEISSEGCSTRPPGPFRLDANSAPRVVSDIHRCGPDRFTEARRSNPVSRVSVTLSAECQ